MISTLFGYVNWQIWLGIFIGIMIMIWIFFRNSEADKKSKKKKEKKDKKKKMQELRESISTSKDEKIDIAGVIHNESDILSGSISSATSQGDFIDRTPRIPEEIVPSHVNVNAKTSKREEKCREILERIYGRKFPNSKPHWLKNPESKRLLEIDCYNHDLKVGLECNGIQHYVWPNFTRQSKEEFEAQVRRDNFKVNMCDRYGVYLITVPYNVPDNQLEKYIRYYLPEE